MEKQRQPQLRRLKSKRLEAATNDFGNIEVPAPSGLVHVPGRVHQLCSKLGIPYVAAVVGFRGNKRFGSSPRYDGVVIDVRHEPILRDALASRKTIAPEEREKRRRTQAARRAERLNAAALEIGAEPNGRLAKAYLRGTVDKHLARLLAFKARYRHSFTDYDLQFQHNRHLRHQEDDMRQLCRDLAIEKPIPADWDAYLEYYDFDGPIAEALAKTLKDPRKCHPTWFAEAMIAIERRIEFNLAVNLKRLTYNQIRKWIADWRDQRQFDD